MTSVRTPRGFYLGKLDPVRSPFPEFKTYFETAPGTPPPQAHWGGLVKVPWQMDGNGPDPDVTIAPPGWPGCGDCVEAYKAHGLTNANFDEDGQTDPVPSANAVVEEYAAYQRCTPAELFAEPGQYDNGEDMTNSLLGWCKHTQYGVRLALEAPIKYSSQPDLKNGIYLGGGIGLGIQIQEAQDEQFPGTWEWVPGSPIIGGHAIWVSGYDADFVYLVTWGALIKATWNFVANAADEAHTAIFPQAVAAGKAPSGLLIARWEADLHGLAD